jgi:Cu+-exporting ATPase
MEKLMVVEGMSCGHCSARVEKALMELDGVSKASVNLDTKEVRVELTGDLSADILTDAVEDAGYDVVDVK